MPHTDFLHYAILLHDATSRHRHTHLEEDCILRYHQNRQCHARISMGVNEGAPQSPRPASSLSLAAMPPLMTASDDSRLDTAGP